MTLQTQYEAGIQLGSFSNRVMAALWEKCLTQIQALTFSATPTADEKREARTIRNILNMTPGDQLSIVRLLVSADVTDASTDVQIQNAINSNWVKIVLLFDPSLDA